MAVTSPPMGNPHRVTRQEFPTAHSRVSPGSPPGYVSQRPARRPTRPCVSGLGWRTHLPAHGPSSLPDLKQLARQAPATEPGKTLSCGRRIADTRSRSKTMSVFFPRSSLRPEGSCGTAPVSKDCGIPCAARVHSPRRSPAPQEIMPTRLRLPKDQLTGDLPPAFVPRVMASPKQGPPASLAHQHVDSARPGGY